MKHLISTKALAAVAVALGAFATTSSAHARSDVNFSIGVQVPGIYVQPTPVYVQPRPIYTPVPVYVQPRPIYTHPPVQYGRFDSDRRYEGQHWQGRSPYGDHGHNGIANVYESSNPRNQWQQARLHGPYGDLDRDGIMNQRDRDRDGDGVRNTYDRRPSNPYRR